MPTETLTGPYRVEYGGSHYFGNVGLCEIHIFERDGEISLYNVDSKAALRITARQAAMIRYVDRSFGSPIPESVFADLQQLKVIPSSRTQPDAAVEAGTPVGRDENAYAVTRIALFVAQDCNMSCVYCYGHGGVYDKKGMMTAEMAFRAVDWLIRNSFEAKDINIGFFGGEPLLNFGLIKQVVSYAKERAAEAGKHVHFSITTNGSLLTDEIIKLLKDEDVEVLVSFDGPAEYQNSKRPFANGKDSHDKVVAKIQKLKAAIPNLTARATVCEDMDPARVREGIEEAGFTNYSIVTASPADLDSPKVSSRQNGGELQAKMDTYNRSEAAKLLTAIRNRTIDRANIPSLLHLILAIDSGEKRYYGCGVGKGMAGISITGDVYPCHRFVGQKEFRLGNVDAYKAGVANEYWNAVVDTLPECASCWARHLCGGGCSYHNKALTGDLHKPAPSFCNQTRAMFEGLIHVYCELTEEDRVYVREIANTSPHNVAASTV